MVFFETCGPNEAMVVSGVCHSKPALVTGGRIFVWPVVQTLQKISLNTMTLNVESPRVYTRHGVPISVTGIAQVKIQGQNQEMLFAACQQFLGKSPAEIRSVALETLEGHQRAIMGTMTVEEIYKDRKKFSKSVFEVASSDLVNMGVSVVSYTIKDIRDDEGYLHALGMARTAQVKRDARIGEAEAKRDSGIKEALADEARMRAKFENDTEIAKAKRDYELKKAAYDIEVFTKKAQSQLAYDLQASITKQKIKEEEMQIKVVERSQQINVQEQEIQRKERELEANIKRPAEADKYKTETLAEANKNRVILEAEAEAEAIRVKGEAEAFAIEAKAKAEAEQMAKKADAWKEYREAAVVDMVLETMPKIAAEVAAPLSQCKKIVMVSNGQSDVGASKITAEILDIVSNLPKSVEALTGIDISKSMRLTNRV
ncbi:flotillin-1-like [Acropora millepora]|uniref:flotillin-1-like n=2 Tax=Acropora TaxID=6127 RepID=UPI0010FC7FE2|nr:flotillin-1-like [Acropora millepora]XP_044178756.1 flotillin-1-like [Acropora millepora]